MRLAFHKYPELLSLLSNPNGISRIQLARAAGLSPSNVGKMVRGLLEAGLLAEEGNVETERGRQPTLLRPSRNLGILIGVDVGMINCRVVATDMQGSIIGTRRRRSHANGDVSEALKRIFGAVDSLLDDLKTPRDKLLAVGVSFSGGVDPETGECLYWHSAMQWKGISLSQRFSERYRVTCKVDDSVRCMTLAEKSYGKALDSDTFVFINIGHGIGSGLYLDGRIYRGSGFAGEIGHTVIVPNGPLCSCGNYGCLEVLASGHSIVSSMRAALESNVTTQLRKLYGREDPGDGLTVEEVAEAARHGDRMAHQILDRSAEHIGIAVGNMLNFLNPGLVVLGGAVMDSAGDILLEAIRRQASRIAFRVVFQRVRICSSELGENAAARGAALMMTETAMKEVLSRTAGVVRQK